MKGIKDNFTVQTSDSRHQGHSGSLVRRFNPYDFGDEQVLRQFTGREHLLSRIMRVIDDNLERREPPNQHLMVLGNRGMGKSFLVRRVQIAVDLAAQTVPLVFVRLPEEQLNVSAPELLLDEIRRILTRTPAKTVRVKWRSGDEQAWHQSAEALRASIAKQPGFSDDTGLLVVSIENFDSLLQDVFEEDAAQSRLREFMASEPRVMFLTTSTTEADNKHRKRLFQAFRREQLLAWGPGEFVAFYRKTFTGEITDNLESKIRALAHLMGGSPRLAVLIGDVLHTNDALSAVQILNQLADELTPYFQDRIMSRLGSKSRWLLDDLLRGGEPCSQTELARRVGAESQSDIARPFTVLLREGIVVDRRNGGKSGQYQVSDRFFAHFYRQRYLADESHSPLAHLVPFLEDFYSQREQAEQLMKSAKEGRTHEAQLFAETLRHGQDVWGKADEGNRIHSARGLIRLTRQCMGSKAEGSFWEALTAVADKMSPKKAGVILQDVQQLSEFVQDLAGQIVVDLALAAVWLTVPKDDRALEHAENALTKSREIGHKALTQLSLHILGLTEAFAGKRQDAKRHFSELLAEEIANRLYIEVIPAQVWNLNILGEFEEAVTVCDRALNDPKILQDQRSMACLLHSYAYAKAQQNGHKAGFEAIEKAAELSRQADNDYLLSSATKILSWFLHHFERYDEALSAARVARAAGERANDDFLVLAAIHMELSCLNAESKHQALIDRAPAVIELAKTVVDSIIESKAQSLLAGAHQALDNTVEALSARRAAATASLKSNDIELASHLHRLLFNQLEELEPACSYEIVDRFLIWAERWIESKEGTKSRPWHSTHDLNILVKAATLSDRWPEVVDRLAHTPGFLDGVQGTSPAIGDAVIARYQAEGTGPAFSLMAGFLRALREPLARAATDSKLDKFLRTLFGTTCGQLVTGLPNSGLLQDVAVEVREQLQADDVADMLEVTALYRAQGDKQSVLDEVDPDIGETVRAVLGIADSDPKSKKIKTPVIGYQRADHLVTEQERTAQKRRLSDENAVWAAPPLYTDKWKSPARDRAVALVVAALGAARRAMPRSVEAFVQLSRGVNKFGIVTARALSQAKAVRVAAPIFYPGWQLAEISVNEPNDATISFLVTDKCVIPLLGASPPIHELNSEGAITLESEAEVASYLRFFCSAVRGDEGPFTIVDSIEQIPLAEPCTKIQTREISKLILPVTITREDKKAWTTKALVNYSNQLFHAEFRIQTSGMVEMLDDELVMTLEHVKQERVVSGLRYYDGVLSGKKPDEL